LTGQLSQQCLVDCDVMFLFSIVMTSDTKFLTVPLFVAIDRTSKLAFVEIYAKAGKMNAAQFLRNLIAAVPYSIHIVLTENCTQFTNQKRHNMHSTISSTRPATKTRASIV
jgi:hypothetical protein